MYHIGKAEDPSCPCDGTTRQSGIRITFDCHTYTRGLDGCKEAATGKRSTDPHKSRSTSTNMRTGLCFSSRIFSTTSFRDVYSLFTLILSALLLPFSISCPTYFFLLRYHFLYLLGRTRYHLDMCGSPINWAGP